MLLEVPFELLEQILLELDPVDVAQISQTCTALSSLIHGASSTQLFWRKLYLTLPLDDPRKCLTHLGFKLTDITEIDWKVRVKRVIRARTVVKNPEVCRGTEEKCAVLETLLDLACNTVPLGSLTSDELSYNLVWLAALVRGGKFLHGSGGGDDGDKERRERQLRARFHVMFGVTTTDFEPRQLLESRCIVYALRNYKAANNFGPYLMDGSGRVNWEHLHAIQHVMSMHIIPRTGNFRDPGDSYYVNTPMSLPFCNTVLPPDVDLDNTPDWAGIEGEWHCSVCFCDHRDLLAINNYASHDDPLHVSIFQDPNFMEAFTVVPIHIHVTGTEFDPDHPKRPIIHFQGQGEGLQHQGWVRLTPDNQIRWHFIGNHTWSSEGIQVGNIRSTYGVVGVWSAITRAWSDPVGPFWLRKVLDEH